MKLPLWLPDAKGWLNYPASMVRSEQIQRVKGEQPKRCGCGLGGKDKGPKIQIQTIDSAGWV